MNLHMLLASLSRSRLPLLHIALVVGIIYLSLFTFPLPFAIRSHQEFVLEQRQISTLRTLATQKIATLRVQAYQLKLYNSLATTFQTQIDANQHLIFKLKTISALLALLHDLDQESLAVHSVLLKDRVLYTLKLFHTEVGAWARAHPYHDDYDNHDYAPNNAYMLPGLGSLLDHCMRLPDVPTDLQTCLSAVEHALFFLHMFEADYQDSTPYNQAHATDLQLLVHEHLQRTQAIVVSLAEQVMRVYQHGHLLQAFYVTTGRSDLPSLPGLWAILDRRSSLVFVSTDPPDSTYWFPDTPIQYALLYHEGGYFVHDAPWRSRFGPGTQFPHADPLGTTPFNFDGSHGCVNLQEQDTFWLYLHTNWQTTIVIY